MNELFNSLLQQGYDKEQIKQILGLGPLGEEEGRLGTQMEMARELKDTPGPEGRQAGRTYVAANPLEHIGAGLKQFQGQRDVERTRARQAEVAQEQAALRAMLFKARGGQGGAIGGTPAPQMGIQAPQAAQLFPTPGIKY